MSTILRPVLAAGLVLRAEEAARRWAGQAPPMGPAGAMKADAPEAMHCKVGEKQGEQKGIHRHSPTSKVQVSGYTTAAKKFASQPASCLTEVLSTRSGAATPHPDHDRISQPPPPP